MNIKCTYVYEKYSYGFSLPLNINTSVVNIFSFKAHEKKFHWLNNFRFLVDLLQVSSCKNSKFGIWFLKNICDVVKKKYSWKLLDLAI